MKDICIPTFTAALFTIAWTWKQPRCLSTNELYMQQTDERYMQLWKKLWYVYTIKYYLSNKRNEFESVLVRWMNLDPVTQSEVKWKSLSRVWLFATPWTIQSTEFSRTEYWSGYPFSRRSSQPGDWTQASHIAGGFFTTWLCEVTSQREKYHILMHIYGIN